MQSLSSCGGNNLTVTIGWNSPGVSTVRSVLGWGTWTSVWKLDFCSQVVLLALTAHSFDISVLCIQFECFLCFVLFPPFAIFVSKTHSTVVSPWLLKQITFDGIALVFKFISTEGYSKLVVTTRTHYRKLKENPLHSLYY